MYNRKIVAEDGYTYKKRILRERRRNRMNSYRNYNSYQEPVEYHVPAQEYKPQVVNHQESIKENQEGTLIKPRKFMLKYTK